MLSNHMILETHFPPIAKSTLKNKFYENPIRENGKDHGGSIKILFLRGLWKEVEGDIVRE